MKDIYKNIKSEINRSVRKLLETDLCDFCMKKKATITDKTYVYCSEKCKELFIENTQQAIEESMPKLNFNKE